MCLKYFDLFRKILVTQANITSLSRTYISVMVLDSGEMGTLLLVHNVAGCHWSTKWSEVQHINVREAKEVKLTNIVVQ